MIEKISLETRSSSLYELHKNIFSALLSREAYAANGAASQLADYFQKIILCMPGNVYWMDKDCQMVGCNQNVLDMFGIDSLDDFYGLSFEELAVMGHWNEGQAVYFKRDTVEVIKTGKIKADVEEPPIPGADGCDVYFLTTRVPLFNVQDEVIGIVGISIDITARRRAEEAQRHEKERANLACEESKAKTEFLANMSHDVRTPLSGLIGCAELLTVKLEDKSLQEFAQDMLTSSEKLMEFFDDTLELSRLEMSELDLTHQSFNLKSVAHDIALLFKPLVTLEHLSLTVECDDCIPDVLLGSRSHIYRIVQNLVGNAIKFTEEGGVVIRLRLDELSTPEKAVVYIVVEDTGTGMPCDKLDVIFEKMSRLTASYGGIHEGHGMGLYIVDKFVKAMGGEIFVKSEEGKGSQFTVVLSFERLSEGL